MEPPPAEVRVQQQKLPEAPTSPQKLSQTDRDLAQQQHQQHLAPIWLLLALLL